MQLMAKKNRAAAGESPERREVNVKIRGVIADAVDAYVADFPAYNFAAYVTIAVQEKLIADGYLKQPRRPSAE